MNRHDPTNDAVAGKLDQAAALLEQQSASPFRVRAYRRGAAVVRDLPTPVSDLIDREGLSGLERLPGIGSTLARAIHDIVRLGYFPMLDRLRGESDPVRLLASIPGIGRGLATRLHDELGLETLEDVEAAAHDGRLEALAGFGRKRIDGIRDVLAQRLARVRPAPRPTVAQPPVAELLDVDREYRSAAAAGRLPRIAPRRFNPGHRRWLPILHTTRNGRHYTALFSNTARAHQLGKTDDWVVIYGDHRATDGRWTVVTATRGRRAGRRVVRGREDELS